MNLGSGAVGAHRSLWDRVRGDCNRGPGLAPVAVYIHIPFCPSKCGYCDFNSYAMSGDIVQRTAKAIATEIRRSPWRGRPAKTIFFGGGTPTFLSEEQLLPIIEEVIETHPPVPNAEITSEANPGTVDIPKFKAMHQAGINRISLGAQSFQAQDLVRLGRVHKAHEVARAVSAARDAGFEQLNLDLMFGLPGQSPRAWERNLEIALSLQPNHLSLYGLTIEPNTRFYKLGLKGMLDLPQEDDLITMYEQAMDKTLAAGLQQYEISNFAQPGCESQHNLCYWRGEEYLGYGPGAVGCVATETGRTRFTVFKHPERYSDSIDNHESVWFDEENLNDSELRMERIMLGLRLQEGLPLAGNSIKPESIDKMQVRGWITQRDNRLTLTRAGRHFCTEVAAELA